MLARHVAPRAQPEHDVERERVTPNDPVRDRREAILGRHREVVSKRVSERERER